MKKFQVKVAMLLTAWSLVSMGGAMADDKNPGVSKVKVVKSEQKKIRLYTPEGDQQQSQAFEVTIMDPNGVVLYEGKAGNKGQDVTSFDLKNLPDGRYFLRASSNGWWMSQGLTIQNDNLTVDELDYNLLLKPSVEAYGQNKFQMTFPTASSNTAQVWILNRWGEEVYSDKVSSEKTYYFDLTRLPSGPYKIVTRLAQTDFEDMVSVK